MSPSPSRWQAIAASDTFSFVHVANDGIRLSLETDRVIASPHVPLRPQIPVPLSPVILPRLPLKMVMRCSRFLRELYLSSQRLYCFALYLDFHSQRWKAVLPGGASWPSGYRIDLRGLPPEQLNDGRPWRLAGTIQSCLFAEQPEHASSEYTLTVPVIEGVHVQLDPRFFFLPRLALRVGENLYPSNPVTSFAEPPSGVEQVSQRLQVLDQDPA